MSIRARSSVDEVAVEIQVRQTCPAPYRARSGRAQVGPVGYRCAGRLSAMTDAATATASRAAWGWGLATVHQTAGVLDTYFPRPALGPAGDDEALRRPRRGRADRRAARRPHRAACGSRSTSTTRRPTPRTPTCGCTCSATGSSRRATLNLDGIFAVLPNVVWTSAGPCAVDGFETVRARLRAAHGHVTVFGVDKFPRMVDYVLPSGVRIADADRVRLGAHLAEGTTVMHEGFVNYNAGTLGTSMVEGRISAGVVVGTRLRRRRRRLDHGHAVRRRQEVISIGERCLLGANAGIGISLGDDCVVEAGPLRHRRHQGHAARRQRGQGRHAVRRERAALPPQLGDRGDRGAATAGPRRRAQRRPARKLSRVQRREATRLAIGCLGRRGPGPRWSAGSAPFFWLQEPRRDAPGPGSATLCRHRRHGRSVAVDLDQAHYASIIVGLSVRRGLAPRAASIALATVYQETGIRNLDLR